MTCDTSQEGGPSPGISAETAAPCPALLSCQTVLLAITNNTHFGTKLGMKMFKEKKKNLRIILMGLK